MSIETLKNYFIKNGYSKISIITTVFPPYPIEANSISVGGATIDLTPVVNFLVDVSFDGSIVAFDFVGISATL